jgi:hypothetical protein
MRRTLAALAAALMVVGLASPPAEAAAAKQVSYQRWATAKQFGKGLSEGTAVAGGKLVIAQAMGQRKLAGATYDWARWTSPLVAPGFDLTELVPSWTATTPGNSWVRIEVRGVTPTAASTGWDTISRWAAGDRYVKRTSLGTQPDGGASVSYDTWKVPGGSRQWQLRVTLFRRSGTSSTPTVDTIGAMSSRNATVATPTSKPLDVALGTVLPVPTYSQMIHEGEYPQFDGGGEAWCSPTSTSMVLGYYGRLPAKSSYAWVKPSYADRFVDHAARMTFDHSFEGTGNWPFNTAYAAGLTGRAFVTRLRSLQDAERFVAAGIPVVASISFGKGQLAGAPISSTNGHLLVIVGFTTGGDVVVNDPAAPKNSTVRRTYDRAQFDAAWMRRSGGLSYVIYDAAHPLPARAGATNW